ncbi:hypothetical protein CFC21_052355 [Triticum aestivum]|uniref:Uncharacterized protein ycf68 n=2 Tax=Triticum aestivum TaxID=4565 RepID=A0A3B6HVS8_WHEAT|nr:hypothetical protein CFC21_052355 [Triticum aestivum]
MAYSSYLNRSLKPNKLLLRRIDGAIQVRSHVDLTFYSLVHLHRPRTTRSPLSFYGDGGIVPFEPFSCFSWRSGESSNQ